MRNFVARSTETSGEITKVTILDLENKFIAFSNTFPEGVREVFSASDEVYLLANNGKVYLSADVA